MAVKYSGLRGPSYANSRKIVENLLQINGGRMTTALICVTLQCGSAQQLADKILHDYQKASKMVISAKLLPNLFLGLQSLLHRHILYKHYYYYIVILIKSEDI